MGHISGALSFPLRCAIIFSQVHSSPLRCSLIPSQVFSIFEDLEISVDVVATSEVSISLTLDPAKLWSRNLIQQVR